MHVLLVHNPHAGDDDHSADALQAQVRNTGHTCRYLRWGDQDPQQALSHPADLVAIAGGDGTIGEILLLLAESDNADRPVAILPLGSANNIARTVGIADTPTERLVEGWTDAERRPFRLGHLHGEGEDRAFAETVGFGLFAELILQAKDESSTASTSSQDKVRDGLEQLRQLLDTLHPRTWSLKLDGEPLVGDFLSVEATRIGWTGPAIELGRKIDPGAAAVTLVLIEEDRRATLHTYIDKLLTNRRPATPHFTRHTCKQVAVVCPAGNAVRIDDLAWETGLDETFSITTREPPLELLH